MKSNHNHCFQGALILLSLLFFSSCQKEEMIVPSGTAVLEERSSSGGSRICYGLTVANELIKLRVDRIVQELDVKTITGLQPEEWVRAIDFRPATGQLYGVTNQSRIYIISHQTGAATALSSSPFTPAIEGTEIGFDFNPTVDRIRLVTNSGQNLRLHPETGMVVAVDGSLNPGTPEIHAVAYTNSFAGASSTTLYDVDFTTGKLFRQNPPNNGTLEEIGSIGFTRTGDATFDISPDNTWSLIACDATNNGLGGVFGAEKSVLTRFYSINLTSGATNQLGASSARIIGIAIPTLPVAYAVDLDNRLLIFNPQRSAEVIEKIITGMQVGEKVLGIDMRPATGQLFALGSTSRLYTINTANGMATPVGQEPFSQKLNGKWFGFDFNPTVDRIRIVSNTGQNLRAHPVTGAIAVVDGALNPGSPAMDASAYTLNFPGTTTTQLFGIDYNTDQLYLQSPPNNGTLNVIGDLGWDVIQSNGFDIGGTSNEAMGIFTTPDAAYLCRIDIASGQMNVVAPFRDDVRGFALGLGF